LIQAEPEDALRMLRVGKVDVALVFRYQAETAGSPHDPDLRFHPLLDEPVFLITPAARPARTGSGRDTAASTPPAGTPGANILAEYAGHRWIAGCERCQDVLFRLCRSAGFSPDIAVMTDDYVAAQALVAAGFGTAILPGLALRALRHPGIAAIELPGTRRHVLAATYGGPPERAAASALLTALGRAAAHFSGDRLGTSASPA
jgi:DNA-binding transcriptional LysR family regulator